MEEKLIVLQSANSAHYSHRNSEYISGLYLVLLMVIGISILKVIAILVCVNRSKRQQNLFKPKLSLAICDRCEYFNNNHFLKCALHPVTVLTKESASCRDYQQNIRAK
jgi:hypothetical protein